MEPSLSEDPLLLKLMLSPTSAEKGPLAMLADGETLGASATNAVVLAVSVAPSLSVTVSVTV